MAAATVRAIVNDLALCSGAALTGFAWFGLGGAGVGLLLAALGISAALSSRRS